MQCAPGRGLVWFGLVWFGLVWFGLVNTSPVRETNAPRAPRITPRAHRALVFELLFYALLADFQCGKDAVASGVHIRQRRPPLHPPHHCNGGCSCPHPLPGGAVELKETSLARPTTEEGAPHGCPNLRSIRFATFGVSNLTGCSFP